MMENAVLKLLETRRSVRSYQDKQVDKETLDAILRAGTFAATGMNRQSPIIVAVQNKETIQTLSKMNAAVMGRDGDPFYGAPTVVLVSSVMNPAPMDNVKYSDAAGIVENMALAATEIGVGACHIWGAVRALNASPDLLAELNLPQGRVPCCAIALGHTDEVYTRREIKKNRIATDFFKGE